MNHFTGLHQKKGVHHFRYFLLMNTYCCLLMCVCIVIEMGSNVCTIAPWCVHWTPCFNKKAYMHEQTAIEFGVRIVGRKNLNPFLCTVSLWSLGVLCCVIYVQSWFKLYDKPSRYRPNHSVLKLFGSQYNKP